MARFTARPINRLGVERAGTDGVLSGTARSPEAFARYVLHRWGREGVTYNVYVHTGVSTAETPPLKFLEAVRT